MVNRLSAEFRMWEECDVFMHTVGVIPMANCQRVPLQFFEGALWGTFFRVLNGGTLRPWR